MVQFKEVVKLAAATKVNAWYVTTVSPSCSFGHSGDKTSGQDLAGDRFDEFFLTEFLLLSK